MIELKDISLGYASGRPLLEGANLKADKGEMIALVGRNGSGKSTLLRSILGIHPLQGGTGKLLDQPLESCSSRMRSRSISFVSAAVSSLPSMRVRDLISLGRIPHTGWMGKMGEEDLKHLESAASKLELLPYLDRQVEMLSDGEKQRVMIARALVQDTPIMVLDEPAAYLDIPHRYDLLHILGSLRDEGKCILFSTHDLEMAMNSADKFWVIADRQIYEGAPEDLGMAGIFDQLFQDSGIAFDLEHGRFRSLREARGKLCLKAEPGALRQWTCLAMERIGFEIAGEKAPLEIRVEQEADIPRWLCHRDGHTHVFNDLYALTRFLTGEE